MDASDHPIDQDRELIIITDNMRIDFRIVGLLSLANFEQMKIYFLTRMLLVGTKR